MVFIVQLVFCKWWLQRYTYGPVEWIWRSLTFGKWFPLKKQQPAHDAMATMSSG
jgi:uncharacterized protein